ncbi:hypothetical protein FOXYS1_3867 [Fusarium oxysporum]|uniref:Uncharacterized protein n=1 Tax=Fusarium oxysporum TaxID=5507 RepID=A0A8H5AHN7_FUSOX|nr:hypothetical protein FOXYS1_3867 [Fusarium oxysporum]
MWPLLSDHSPRRMGYSMTQLDIIDNGLVSISLSTAEILGLPQLTTLPSEVLQLIRAYSRGSFIWTYPAIKAKAEEMARFDESISKDDGMQYNLRIVKEWHRGQDAELDEDPPESGVFRFTLDSNGLLDIERLSDWPEYKSCRCRTHKYFFIDCAEAQRTCIFQNATCNRTLDLRNITGITFFFYRGTLMGLHAHTLGAVTAVSTVKDTLSDYEPHLVWIHIPIPHGDRIMRFGLRTWRNEHEEPANHHTALLMTTKLAGDFSLGPSFDMEDQNFLFQGTPTVLVHNTPGKGGITLLGIAGDEPQETLPAPRFPVISLSPYELAYGGNAITVDISLKGTVRVDIFKDSSTGCFRGFLLEFENGSQRTAGQCRVGVDPVTVCHKPVSFCYRKVQGGDFDVHKYYELECCPETGDPHYDHASPDGAWTCSDFGVSQEFITIEDLIQQCGLFAGMLHVFGHMKLQRCMRPATNSSFGTTRKIIPSTVYGLPQNGGVRGNMTPIHSMASNWRTAASYQSMSPDSEVWAYLAIKDLAEGISSAAGQDDSQSCMLDRVESWTRGEGAPVISDSTAGDWGIRVTKDRRGIRKTERLVGLPSYALIPPDQARTSGVDFRIGAARIKLSGNGKSVMWDTPNPPRSGKLSFFAPCDNERLCDMRLRTLDLRSTRGLTFFYVGSSLRAIHSHTSRFPTASTTYARLLEHARKHAVWAHVPISPNDRLIGSGIRTSGMDNVFTSPSVLVRTKLVGDIVIGPQFRPVHPDFALVLNKDYTCDIIPGFLIYDIPATEDE